MSPWLHDVDALATLADGPPGEVRDWANTRLALRAPERMARLPTGAFDATLAVLVGARGAVDAVADRIGTIDAAVLDAIGWAGQLPSDPTRWVGPLVARARRSSPADLPTIARLLADLGGLDGATLSAAARTETVHARRIVPGLVLRFAEVEGHPVDAVATEVVGQVFRRGVSAGELLSISAVLGLPQWMVFEDQAGAAAREGAARAGGALDLPEIAGAGGRRPDRVVRAVLDGVPGAAAAWLRALAALDGDHRRWICGMAGWLAAWDGDEDPVEAVTVYGAGEDRRLLAAARRALVADDVDRVEDALDALIAPPSPSLALAAALVASGGRGADRLAARLVDEVHPDRLPCQVVGLSRLGGARFDGSPAAWVAARYVPTEQMLATALEGGEDDPTEALERRAWALAEMADPAAYAAVIGWVARHPQSASLAEARAHAARLLNRH